MLLWPPVRERVQDIFWFVAKVAFFMYLYIWYRGTFPRYRFDQLMKIGWKVLLPIWLAVLILTAVVGVAARVGRAGRGGGAVKFEQLLRKIFLVDLFKGL